MNNRETILDFLNRYYRVELGKFFDITLEQNVYGSIILEHLIAVLSIDEEICMVILTEWAFTNMTPEDFENNWEFKTPNPLNLSRYFELKKMNRFSITFPEYFNIPEWVLVESSRPNMKLITKKIFGFELFNSFQWDDLVIKLHDPISPSTSQSLMNLICLDTENNHKVKEKFSLKIEMLDPIGNVVERWNLVNCEFKSINFGELSYGSDNFVTCTLIIKLDRVILEF